MQISEIVKNKSEIIRLKKAEIKSVKGGVSFVAPENTKLKSVYFNSENKLQRTIIGNTYNWMDEHDDVHAFNIFSKSIKENKQNIFHLHDHLYQLSAKVGEPIDIYENKIKWSDLGINKEGETMALFMDTEIIKSYNEKIFDQYFKSKINQHSVGMQYVKIDLATKSDEYEEEHKIWVDNIDKIGNKEKAEEKEYFWLVREAKLIEISAVLKGSNGLTPTLENKEAVNDTSKKEPSNDTQLIDFLTKLKI